MNTSPVKESLPELPEAVAHMAKDYMRAITETELALIPNKGSDEGRRERCRLLYRTPLYTADQLRKYGQLCALQAIAAPREGWQPIETAPKDRFLLLAAEFDGPGDWRIKMGEYRSQPDEHGRHWHLMGASWTPTRWHAIPAAPLAVEATDPKETP